MVEASTPEPVPSLAQSLGADAMSALVEALWNGPTPLVIYGSDLRIVRANAAMARLLGFPVDALPGKTIEQTAPQLAASVRPAFERALATNTAILGVHASGETAGHPDARRSFLGNIYPFSNGAGGPGGLCVAVVDVTELRRREQDAMAARADAERASRQLNQVQELTAALSAALEPEQVAETLLDRGMPIVEACAGRVCVYESGPEPCFTVVCERSARKSDAAHDRCVEIAPRSPCADALATRAPVWIRSPAEFDARYPSYAEALREMRAQSWAAIPLIAGDQFLGVVNLGFAEPRAFDGDLARSVLAVAELGRQALERSRLYASEQRLRTEAQRAAATLDAFIAASPAAIALLDDDERVQRVNPAFTELMGGKPAAEFLGRRIQEQLPAIHATTASVAGAGAAPVPLTLAGLGAAGGARHLLATTFPVSVDGHRLGFGSIITDVTPMRQAELERERLVVQLRGALHDLDVSAALVESLFRAAPLAIALLDSDLRYLRVNPAAASIDGIAAEDHVGRRMRDVVHSMWDQVAPTLERVLLTGDMAVEGAFSCETPARPGQIMHFQGSFLPVRVQGGATAVGMMYREVTAAKNAEVFQRYVLGIVGHDLRNPLSAMTSAVGYLLRAPNLNDRQRSLLDRALSSGGRMERIIRDLLDFTRLSAGNGVPINPRETTLDEICRPLLDEMEAANPRRVIAYEPAGGGRGVWDPDRLGQVLANLLTNAIKYAPPDSPVVLRWRDDAQGATVEVENYGPPIPAAMMPLLFEPFARAAAHETRKPGIGLGLYIARQLVRAHGGDIECRSGASATCFIVHLPREAPHVEEVVALDLREQPRA